MRELLFELTVGGGGHLGTSTSSRGPKITKATATWYRYLPLSFPFPAMVKIFFILFVKAQFSKSKNLLCIVEGLYPVKSSKFYDKTKDYCTYTTNNNNTKY